MKNINKKYVVGLTIVMGAIGYLAYTAMTQSFRYYVTVSELVSNLPKFQHGELKIAGVVKEGSIQDRDDLTHTFVIQESGQTVSVDFAGMLPDTFKPGAEVVVTGRLTPTGSVTATHVLAKCGSRYEAKVQS